MGEVESATIHSLSSVGTHSSLEHRAVKQLQLGKHVCIRGLTGSGHTWLLHRLRSNLEQKGISTVLFNARDEQILASVEGISGAEVVLIEGFDGADEELVQQITACARQGVRVVFSLETPGDHAVIDAIERCGGSRDDWADLHHINLTPVAPEELHEYIHLSAARHIDGVLADTIVRLSHGRPVWADILLTLASEGYLATFPHSSLLFDAIPQPLRDRLPGF